MTFQTDILIVDGVIQLAETLAELFSVEANEAVRSKNNFMTAISGGSTPRQAHRLLTKEVYRQKVPWDDVHLFWVDDRCVEVNDESSNYGTALRDFVSVVDIPENQVFPMPTSVNPQLGAEQYEQTVRDAFTHFEISTPQFDCIFLGMGTDGHTASLFPDQEVVWSGAQMVLAVKGGHPNVDRLTMNFSLINQAKHIVVIASGKEKAQLINKIFSEDKNKYPIQRVEPINGKLTWLLDKQASSLL